MRPRTFEHRRGGFSFIELTIAVAILGLIMGAVMSFQLRSEEATGDSLGRAETQELARRVLDVAARELNGVGRSQVAPDPSSSSGADSLTFQKPMSVTNTGAIVWSTTSRLQLLIDDGEADNAADDDGDGLVDERRLVLTKNVGLANETDTTIAHGLADFAPGETANAADDNGNGVSDERGFNVQRTGDLLTLRVWLQRRLSTGEIITVAMDTALVLHN